MGDDKHAYIPVKWSRQCKIDQDKKKSSTVVGRNWNTFKRKKVSMTPNVEIPVVKFPCIVEGCSHAYFGDDGKFLDHMIKDHSIVEEECKATALPMQVSLQSETSPSELSPCSSPDCVVVTPVIESPSICFQDSFALPVDVNHAYYNSCVSDNSADPRGGETSSLTAASNDCTHKTYLLTLSQYFCLQLYLIILIFFSTFRRIHASVQAWLGLGPPFIYILYVCLLLLAGDIECNPGPTENKRVASGEPHQNKKRKRDGKV